MLWLPVTEGSQTGEARRQLVRLAERTGLDESSTARVALVTTELATNLVKHSSSGGELLARPLVPPEGTAVEILSIDRGPGIADLARSLQDGFSTLGTPGTGLGALSRLSDLFEVSSHVGSGTVLLARIGSPSAATLSTPAFGGLSIPKPGEEVCGDGLDVHRSGDVVTVLMVDGLGHGPGAGAASLAAIRAFRESPDASPASTLERIHQALRGTRGAAVAIARIEASEARLRYAGIGNISGRILIEGSSSGLVSHNGTAGLQVRRFQEFTYRWSPGSVLVMHSDGLTSRWDLGTYGGVRGRHPALIAGLLYRDHSRGRDDVTVAVVSSSSSTTPVASA